MNFEHLLHVAKQNSSNKEKNGGKYYSTKFSAPKKESKDKKLSDNIKKFLEKKETEEREKQFLEKQKRDELLAKRDEKQKNKIRKMLKTTKSANKSVLEDAIDRHDTAVTLMGPIQPDEDDYGYVSQEANALFAKYMDSVKDVKDDKKFAPSRPISRTDLNSAKDRVRAALMKEQEEQNNPTRSKSKKSAQTLLSVPTPSPTVKKKEVTEHFLDKKIDEPKVEEFKKPKPKRPPPPPAMNFQDLLKIAEKKQFEPVEIEIAPKKEEERPLTQKEKRELEERRLYMIEREKRRKEALQNGKNPPNGKTKDPNIDPNKSNKSVSSNQPVNGINKMKIPLKSATSTELSSANKQTSLKNVNKIETQVKQKPHSNENIAEKSKNQASLNFSSKNSSSSNSINKQRPVVQAKDKVLPPSKSTMDQKKINSRPQLNSKSSAPQKPALNTSVQKPNKFNAPDSRNSKPLKLANKRRIEDDDSEYDSEMDDFIDDGPEETDSYSTYIKEIFGYDKSKYRHGDDDDDAMESSFAQQMREEYVSKKIGIMEDLEDMRLEAAQKRRKAAVKKSKFH